MDQVIQHLVIETFYVFDNEHNRNFRSLFIHFQKFFHPVESFFL
jgi:hypothetical protein